MVRRLVAGRLRQGGVLVLRAVSFGRPRRTFAPKQDTVRAGPSRSFGGRTEFELAPAAMLTACRIGPRTTAHHLLQLKCESTVCAVHVFQCRMSGSLVFFASSSPLARTATRRRIP